MSEKKKKITTRKKSTATGKKTASVATYEASQSQAEVDPRSLPPDDARKRCAAIYELEREVEKKRAAHDLAKKAARAKKAELDDAEAALEKEIRDQRMGPGPLFSADGKGPSA